MYKVKGSSVAERGREFNSCCFYAVLSLRVNIFEIGVWILTEVVIQLPMPRIDSQSGEQQAIHNEVCKGLLLFGVTHATPIPFIPNRGVKTLRICRVIFLIRCVI